MAKLYLKFEQAVLKEFNLSQDGVTIGRLPDNRVQMDNLAVSGHHARIYWEADHYVIEDNSSLNGTYVNNRRISKAILQDGDEVLIGRHTILFKDECHGDVAIAHSAEKSVPAVPKVQDNIGHPAAAAPALAKERIAVLTVVDGRTDQPKYVLTSKLNVIGKSEMASIKLKGLFAPKVAAVINHRDQKYFIVASEKEVRVKVNEAQVAGQHELQDGDIVEVAGVKMTFSLAE